MPFYKLETINDLRSDVTNLQNNSHTTHLRVSACEYTNIWLKKST